MNLSVPLDASFDYLYALQHFNLDFSSTLDFDPLNFDVDDIVASKYFMLYKEDENGEITYQKKNLGAHYVYITGVTDDNRLIISSWGEKYIFDPQNAKLNVKILLKIL